MKTSSRFALVAAAGILMSGVSLSAKAADLGGDIGGDLEARVAELEATTARKGNRKVTLEISGQVDKGILAWDDGIQSKAYIADNNYSSTRFRFKGTGEMAPGWKAGYYLEYEWLDHNSATVTQTDDVAQGNRTALRLRQSNVFVESTTLGRVTIGFQGAAAWGSTYDTNLANSMVYADTSLNGGFYVRDNGALGGTNAANPYTIANASKLTWGTLANTLDSYRLEAARYDTPSIYGFIGSFTIGENTYYDLALRYQKEWNSVRVAAAIAYANVRDPQGSGTSNCTYCGNVAADPNTNATGRAFGTTSDQVSLTASRIEVTTGSISMMHMPTGLYYLFAAGTRHIDDAVNPTVTKDASFYYIQAGIEKKWFSVGKTTLYGEYGNYKDMASGSTYSTGNLVTGDTATRWGAGINQNFDRAALDLYLQYQNWSADIAVQTGTPANKDMNLVMTGARIKF